MRGGADDCSAWIDVAHSTRHPIYTHFSIDSTDNCSAFIYLVIHIFLCD